jgi:hypothetical protein
MRKLLLGCLMASVAGLAVAQTRTSPDTVQVDDQRVRQWNAFADSLYRLHKQQTAGRQIRETEQIGGYARLEGFYREVSYHDAASGRLLSRIQWERDNPERIHTIEVYVYDDRGRLVRDYMAWYLPNFRNAPRQTTINLHHYDGELHGWRQFDASDNRIYERCSRLPDGKVVLELWGEDRISHAEENPRGVMNSPEYRRCFGGLQKTAGRYLMPQ